MTAPDLEPIRDRLARHRQQHLLAFHDQLSPARQADLLGQIDSIDLNQIDELAKAGLGGETGISIPADIAPAAMLPAVPKDDATARRYDDARRQGVALIAAGKVAALIVAGGDGTRLGFSGPKGCLPATPVRHKPLFQVFAEQLLATARRYGAPAPWYVMTSLANDAATRACFAQHNCFGLPARDVFFFTQGRMPAIGLDGRILLADKDRIAFNPDGHGGALTALRRSGALDDMARRGIEFISYFQVDNPLVQCVDPLFIGLHAQAAADMSAKALPKRHPLEKLGNFCVINGKVTVIEYSDLPEALARATRPDGTLLFTAGSIAIHVFARAFVERLTGGGDFSLPFHRARKKVQCVDPETGQSVQPAAPNAVKFERFVFDALPLARNAVILETRRSEEFSPVKNASGEDSLATSLRDQAQRAAEWLERAGQQAPRDAQRNVASAIEISPLCALDADELRARLSGKLTITPGQELYLG